MSEVENVEILPVLPLKNSVLFPHLLMPLSVGRPASLAAVEAALATEEKEIFIIAQRDPNVEKPGQDDLYSVGTKAVIKRMSRPTESHMELIVLGVERMVLLKLEQTEPYLKARLRPYPLPCDRTTEVEALHRAVMDWPPRLFPWPSRRPRPN
jgi:ATP-dependent Lon protease